MIKLKNILVENTVNTEVTRSIPIEKSEAIDIVLKHCKTFLTKKTTPIYRGLRKWYTAEPYLKISPSRSVRTSKNTSNYYTLLFDILPSWKNFPKRSRSVVCSTKPLIGYGEVYNVIPFDGAKIGVCTTDDFWWSFPNIKKSIGISTMDTFNDILKLTYKDVFEENLSEQPEKFYSQIQKFNEVDKKEFLLKSKDVSFSSTMVNVIMMQFLNSKKDFISYIDDLLNPVTNEFELHSYESFNNIDTNREVWTDSDCLLISKDEYTQVVSDLEGYL